MQPSPLPIDGHIDAIRDALARARAAVVTAAPGAGKTTRVPPALAADGPVVLLQPRRVAARSVAARIASERGWTLGDQVGWQVRFERRATDRTRLLVVTEGILTAFLQRDPLATAYRTIVIDEFHERSIHADLALALVRQAFLARTDLRLVVMSATLETAAVSAFLGGCPVIDVPGREHPVEIGYRPGLTLPLAVGEALARTRANVLCFLPGAPEINRAVNDVRASVPPGTPIVPLHGSLDSESQDRALAPSAGRRVILATNIAETSLTVPGLDAVVDTGLHKVARYDADRAIDSLDVERIPQDSADQRAGRAGRLGPGIAIRLWDARDRLQPHREPEIARVDLSAPALDVLAWGANPREFEWFERPPSDAIDAAMVLLERLGAVSAGRLTPIGDQLRRLPLHPRLARILVGSGGAWDAAVACAVLSERRFLPSRLDAVNSDLLPLVDAFDSLPPHVQNTARQIHAVAGRVLERPAPAARDEQRLLRAIFAAYPDRLARRRAPASPRVVLASGHGASIGSASGVVSGEFVVAVDVQAGRRGAGSEAVIRVASLVEREWIVATSRSVEHDFDAGSGTVRAREVERYDELVIDERPCAVDPAVAAQLLAMAWLSREPSERDAHLLNRLAFAGLPVDSSTLARDAATRVSRVNEIELKSALSRQMLEALDRLAPEHLRVPSGRSVTLSYAPDGTVTASVKLQELFGFADTPRIGPNRVPVRFALLAPNGRPVQLTSDLRSFWERTYPEVRKELRGRYPKHPWPEDPWTAQATSRTTRKKR